MSENVNFTEIENAILDYIRQNPGQTRKQILSAHGKYKYNDYASAFADLHYRLAIWSVQGKFEIANRTVVRVEDFE